MMMIIIIIIIIIILAMIIMIKIPLRLYFPRVYKAQPKR